MDPIWVVVLFGLYVVPSLIAAVRRPTMMLFVMSLNVLLGWTLVAWFVSLALAILLPPAAARAASPAQGPAAPADGAVTAATPPAPVQADFVIDPMRVAALSLLAPVIYQYWWFWRFFEFARRQGFARSRSFWWILIPFYGWAVIGRLFNDLAARLGSARPRSYIPQAALALIVASNVAAGWAGRLHLIPLVVGALALSSALSAVALYQVQAAANALQRTEYPEVPKAGFFLGDGIAVAGGLALVSLLVLGGMPNVSSITPDATGATATEHPTPGFQAVPLPSPTPVWLPPDGVSGTGTMTIASEPGDVIGGGHAVTITGPTAWFNVTRNSGPDAISIMVGSTTSSTRWTVDLAAPKGQLLRDGAYNNAERAAFRSDLAPGLEIGADGRGCNKLYGSFAVTRFVVDGRGRVTLFDASFEQHCESPTAPALRGTIHFEASAAS
jgi:hypothetical protein